MLMLPLLSIVMILDVKQSLAEDLSIGSFYQCSHGLRGKVYVKSKRELVIKGFKYDEKGPAWFHAQRKEAKGVYTSDNDYITLPFPNGTCAKLNGTSAYSDKNKDISLLLPEDIEEFKTIGVFSYKDCDNLGHIVIPNDLYAKVTQTQTSVPVTACQAPPHTPCSLNGTRKGEIHPDCPAGEQQLMSNVLRVLFLVTFTLLSFLCEIF